MRSLTIPDTQALPPRESVQRIALDRWQSQWLSGLLLLVIAACAAGCGEGYKKENGRWAWISWDEAAGRRVHYLDTADAATFRILSNREYAADENFVYHRNLQIKNADPKTFQAIGEFYWRDAKRVFFIGEEIPGADSGSFKSLGRYAWGRDSKDVYLGTIPLHVQDISTFELLKGVWARDSKAYYAGGGGLRFSTVPCDYGSFIILNGSFAKDKNRGYWQGMPLEGSDPATFTSDNEFTAKDKNRSYP